MGAIEVDKRGGAEAGTAGGVVCFNVGSFCDGAGCRSAGSNGSISPEVTSDGEASACLRLLQHGKRVLERLSNVLSTIS